MSRLTGKKIGFIGGGQMGEAVFGGMIAAGAVEPQSIYVSDISQARLDELHTRLGVQTYLNNAQSNDGGVRIVQTCDIVVFSVKPQYFRPVLEAAGAYANAERHLFISIVGGAPLKLLEQWIDAPVIRVMPNTPMLVQAGAAGIAPGVRCTGEHEETAREIFDLLGISYILPERLIDPLTGVSGCGPAYAYLFIEALADAGVNGGLARDVSTRLAAQTLLGAAKMVLAGEHPARLKDSVCSPGGATIAGVHALEQAGFRGAVMDAVEAAVNRMAEVGKRI